MKYPAIVPVPHTGKEHITDEKGNPVSSLLDFWRWAHSDLMGNAERGILAEYLVACALDIPRNVRGLWDRYDLITPEGITIEVKSSGYLQSWGQEHLSTISFGIAPTLGWDDKTNTYETESKRQAQVYMYSVSIIIRNRKLPIRWIPVNGLFMCFPPKRWMKKWVHKNTLPFLPCEN